MKVNHSIVCGSGDNETMMVVPDSDAVLFFLCSIQIGRVFGKSTDQEAVGGAAAVHHQQHPT